MRVRSRLLVLVLILTAAAPSRGEDPPRAPFFSQDGDVTMALQMNKPVADLLSRYGPPDKREPFEWRTHKGELWSYVRTTITTNSKERPATPCLRAPVLRRAKQADGARHLAERLLLSTI